ncbi:MAG: EamA-like transporter family protein [Firmicutes bacterium]|nr:EamA-like transporter family protein [Bacillota bacterium]
MKPQNAGVLIVILSAAGFATLPVFIKLAYGVGANSITVLTTRFILASLGLWFILRYRNLSPKVGIKTGIYLGLLGIAGYGLMSAAFAASLNYLSAVMLSLLFYSYPAIVTLLSFLFGVEEFNWKKGLALVISFVGLFLILGVSFADISLTGIILGMAASIIYATYLLASNHLLKEVDSIVATTYVCSAAAVTFLLTSVFTGEFVTTLPIKGWLILLSIAFFSTIVGILGCFIGLSLIGPSNTAIISTAEPFITVVLSVLLLSEKLTLVQLLGGLLILGSILLLQLWAGKKQTSPINTAASYHSADL